MATSPVAGAQRATQHGPGTASSRCATVATACFAIVAAVVALVFCSLAPAWATDVAESAPERISPEEVAREAFELWNDCQPIAFSVHLQGENEASKIGLTKEAIETAVRSRLRGARIFRDNPDLRSQPLTLERNGFLGVSVYLDGTAVLPERTIASVWEEAPSLLRGDKRSRKRFANVPCARCGCLKVPVWRACRGDDYPLCDQCSPTLEV